MKLDSDRLTKAAVRFAAGLKEGKDEVCGCLVLLYGLQTSACVRERAVLCAG